MEHASYIGFGRGTGAATGKGSSGVLPFDLSADFPLARADKPFLSLDLDNDLSLAPEVPGGGGKLGVCPFTGDMTFRKTFPAGDATLIGEANEFIDELSEAIDGLECMYGKGGLCASSEEVGGVGELE